MAREEHLKPLALVEARLGKTKLEISRYCEVNESTVHRWGHGGYIPAKYITKFLKLARELKVRISAEELICGGTLSQEAT